MLIHSTAASVKFQRVQGFPEELYVVLETRNKPVWQVAAGAGELFPQLLPRWVLLYGLVDQAFRVYGSGS